MRKSPSRKSEDYIDELIRNYLFRARSTCLVTFKQYAYDRKKLVRCYLAVIIKNPTALIAVLSALSGILLVFWNCAIGLFEYCKDKLDENVVAFIDDSNEVTPFVVFFVFFFCVAILFLVSFRTRLRYRDRTMQSGASAIPIADLSRKEKVGKFLHKLPHIVWLGFNWLVFLIFLLALLPLGSVFQKNPLGIVVYFMTGIFVLGGQLIHIYMLFSLADNSRKIDHGFLIGIVVCIVAMYFVCFHLGNQDIGSKIPVQNLQASFAIWMFSILYTVLWFICVGVYEFFSHPPKNKVKMKSKKVDTNTGIDEARRSSQDIKTRKEWLYRDLRIMIVLFVIEVPLLILAMAAIIKLAAKVAPFFIDVFSWFACA